MSAIINSVNNQLSTGRELFLGTERQQIPSQEGTDSTPRRPHTCTGSRRHSHWKQIKPLTFFYLASINCNPHPRTCLGDLFPHAFLSLLTKPLSPIKLATVCLCFSITLGQNQASKHLHFFQWIPPISRHTTQKNAIPF